MKEYWTITYHNEYSPDFLECVHKDMNDKYVFYKIVNYLPDFFRSEYDLDFVMIMHETKTVRVFMKKKEKGGTL